MSNNTTKVNNPMKVITGVPILGHRCQTPVPASAPMVRKQNEHEVLDFMLKYNKLCVILFRDNYSF